MPDSFIAVIFPELLSFPSKKRVKDFLEVCSWHMWSVCIYHLHMPCSLLWLGVGNTICWHCARYYYCYYMLLLFPGSQAERKHKACHYPKEAKVWPGYKLFTILSLLLLPITHRQAWSGRALLVVVGLCWRWLTVVCSPAGTASSVTNARSDADGCLTNTLWNASYLSYCWMGADKQMVLMSLWHLKPPYLILRRQVFPLPPHFHDYFNTLADGCWFQMIAKCSWMSV